MSWESTSLILKDSHEEKRVVQHRQDRVLIGKHLRGKKSGLAAVTLISTPNPVSQVLW
jgi:hypothetical protein